jgi:hypothetical protein
MAQATGEGRGETLVVGPVLAGSAGSASAWIHVLDELPAGGGTLHGTALTGHDAAAIPARAVRFDPASVEALAPRSSREIHVTVRVPARTTPGTYHGHVLATGVPEVVLPLRVEVVGSPR